MKDASTLRVYLTLSIASTFFNATMFTVLTVYYVTVGGLFAKVSGLSMQRIENDPSLRQ